MAELKKTTITGKQKSKEMRTPMMTEGTDLDTILGSNSITTSNASSRRNRSSTIHRTDRFKNIEDSILPFNRNQGIYKNGSNLNVKDAIVLCQKAYYGVAIFRNTIDLMAEFSCGDIFLSDGTEKSRKLFNALLEKINVWDFQDQFFREYYRSGNVVISRHDSTIQDNDVRKLSKEFGILSTASLKIPIKYVILNPAEIEVAGSLSFASPTLIQKLTEYDLHVLRNPLNEMDKAIRKSLPKDILKRIDEGKKNSKGMSGEEIYIPLDPERVRAVFYKKQDYEPLAIPMGFPVLEDINYKKELKKMDMALARTVQQAVLLITIGSELRDGTIAVNQKHIDTLQGLFKNESVGRVLVSDYTTNAKFIIPDIGDILNPKKYEIVNQDIILGLNNVLLGDEKFAATSVKARIFVSRLEQARKAFINNFLQPEINRISKDLGFKAPPKAKLAKIDLDDQKEKDRLIVRMGELGILTPDEVVKAVNDGIFPTPEESRESQKELKTLRKDELYMPAQNSIQQGADNGGRPKGTGTPQRTKNVKPAGASYSLKKFSENLRVYDECEDKTKSLFKSSGKIRRLTKENLKQVETIAEIICLNEPIENWTNEKIIKSYIKSPVDQNEEKVKEIYALAEEHNESPNVYMSILHSSQIEDEE